jgi:acyl-CoA synthetase (AMP-forming)/AMP-acid ligase II
MNSNIARILPETAETFPDRTGLVCRSGRTLKSWTFREIDRSVDRLAHRLVERGVKRGDRVMLMVRPSLDFIALTFALFKIGAVIVLIDPGMGYRNLRRCIGQVAPDVLVGIARAHLFKFLFPKPFRSVRLSIWIGNPKILNSAFLSAEIEAGNNSNFAPFPSAEMQPEDPAAILFTTGSTGPPKGVCYEHSVFRAQLGLIRDYYQVGPGDIDQPAFPLFALFSTGLGACSVVPEMNPARPASVDPEKFIRTIQKYGVTYSFGSPAIWNVVSKYCQAHGITLPSLKKILMAGAPVPGDLLARTRTILAGDAEIHTPYGATESLPVASITASEILGETWEKTRVGKGVCVGRPLPSITIRIIRVSDDAIENWDDSLLLPEYETGEIVVRGPVVTSGYFNNSKENRLAKIVDGEGFWHRMGDVGYLDETGRLWFCGRKGHRVTTGTSTMYSICCEALFNEHPAVYRSALVGVGPPGKQEPVIVVELHDGKTRSSSLVAELRQIAQKSELTRPIEHFLFHGSFPVDIRHNAKIFREELARWATRKLPATVRGTREKP